MLGEAVLPARLGKLALQLVQAAALIRQPLHLPTMTALSAHQRGRDACIVARN